MTLMIPGAREPHLGRPRVLGAMGGAANGSGACAGGSSIDAATTIERQKEGGGGASQRPHGTHAPHAEPGKAGL
jgi:hypothetical protein